MEDFYPVTDTPRDCYHNFTVPSLQTYGLGYETIPNIEEKVLESVFNRGPVLSSDYRVAQDFIDYKNGIYHSTECEKHSLFNHTVLIIGYGRD